MRLQVQLDFKPKVKTEKETKKELPVCSSCGHGRMHIVAVFHERGPPIWLSDVKILSPAKTDLWVDEFLLLHS
jgi:hypothetical protein